MSPKKVSILVFIYNSYKDPLFQNLLLSYIKTLSETGNYRFDLITFEQPEYEMSIVEIQKEIEYLSGWNIYWHPKKYHSGRFILLKKIYDVVAAVLTVLKIRFLHQSTHVFAFANVAAAFSVLFSKFLKMKLVIYSYEPHSEFMAELGLWDRDSLKYRVLSFLEKMAGKYAHHIMTGTKHGVDLLKSLNSKATLYRAPTAVDETDFYFRTEGRSKIRALYKIQTNDVFLYIGKFGDLYYKEEIADLFTSIYEKNQNAHFLIVTRYDHKEIENWMAQRNIPSTSYSLTQDLTNEEIKEYISAADLGISAVPPSNSQKYRSPTKVAEYLLCGLPYITCAGVSEDDDYALENNVGVVLSDFTKNELESNYPTIHKLIAEEKENLRERCRKTGLEYRSKEKILEILKTILTK